MMAETEKVLEETAKVPTEALTGIELQMSYCTLALSPAFPGYLP